VAGLLDKSAYERHITEERPMNASILNYPGFQTLPKGVKQMLVASEAHFFDQPAPHYKEQRDNGYGRRRAWEAFKRSDYEPGVMENVFPCPIVHEAGSLLPRWTGRANKRTICVGAQPEVIAFSSAGAADGVRESCRA
jgi:hypothetical protein